MAVGPAGLPLPAVAPTASPAPRTCVDEGARRAVVDRGRQRSTLRPHPPIEGYCERRRFEETPQRLRAIHRGIAQALARRGRVAEALRHAAEARDTALLGRFAESTGGVRLWLEQDLEGLRTVDGLLTAEVLSAYPRLALVRCVTLTAAGDIDGAQRLYGAAAEETAGFTRDRKGGNDGALQIDHIFVQGPLHMCGCEPLRGGIIAALALPVPRISGAEL